MALAKFYSASADYLLGLTETKNHPNADLTELRLSDEMIELFKSGKINARLLCEMAAHKNFVKLLADIEIYVVRKEIVDKYRPRKSNTYTHLLKATHS